MALGENIHSKVGPLDTAPISTTDGYPTTQGKRSRQRHIRTSLSPHTPPTPSPPPQIGFLVLTLVGVTIPLLMTDPEKMYRTDGSKVTTPRHPSWKTEIYSLIVAFKTDPAIVLL
jgi:hypothetical protein